MKERTLFTNDERPLGVCGLLCVLWLLFVCPLDMFAHARSVENKSMDRLAYAIDSLPSDQFIELNGGLDNFLFRVRKDKAATVAFLGGSITAMKGWRDKVMDYLQRAYPKTVFQFINAGIPSLGSVPHAFRLETDVLSHGTIDLLFVESAVNDLANGTPAVQQRLALEGIVRHALREQPKMNIVVLAFVDEPKIADFNAGLVPAEVKVHSDIASHYRLPFINFAKEVSMRIAAKEFTWKDDFIDLHPSPFGQQVYFRTIRRLLELASEKDPSTHMVNVRMPAAMEKDCYEDGQYAAPSDASDRKGFVVDPSWNPGDDSKTRKRFVDIPMLTSDKPGSSFEFSFHGKAIGIAVVAGPDAGTIRYTIDGAEQSTIDLFTQWSRSLHLPWYLMLGGSLKDGEHTLHVTLLDSHNTRSTGSACRVVYFLVNQ
jgi:hypothetical protein